MQEQGDKGAMRGGVGGGKTMGSRMLAATVSLWRLTDTSAHFIARPLKPDKESCYLQICASLHTSVLKSCTGIPMCICTHGVCDTQGCIHAGAVYTKSEVTQ